MIDNNQTMERHFGIPPTHHRHRSIHCISDDADQIFGLKQGVTTLVGTLLALVTTLLWACPAHRPLKTRPSITINFRQGRTGNPAILVWVIIGFCFEFVMLATGRDLHNRQFSPGLTILIAILVGSIPGWGPRS